MARDRKCVDRNCFMEDAKFVFFSVVVVAFSTSVISFVASSSVLMLEDA